MSHQDNTTQTPPRQPDSEASSAPVGMPYARAAPVPCGLTNDKLTVWIQGDTDFHTRTAADNIYKQDHLVALHMPINLTQAHEFDLQLDRIKQTDADLLWITVPTLSKRQPTMVQYFHNVIEHLHDKPVLLDVTQSIANTKHSFPPIWDLSSNPSDRSLVYAIPVFDYATWDVVLETGHPKVLLNSFTPCRYQQIWTHAIAEFAKRVIQQRLALTQSIARTWSWLNR